MNLSQLAKVLGKKQQTVSARYRAGWTVEEITGIKDRPPARPVRRSSPLPEPALLQKQNNPPVIGGNYKIRGVKMTCIAIYPRFALLRARAGYCETFTPAQWNEAEVIE